jgi:hypothetical protein
VIGLCGVGGGVGCASGRDVGDLVDGDVSCCVVDAEFGIEHGSFEFLDQSGGQVFDLDRAATFGASEADCDCYGCHASIVTESVT